MNTYRTSDGTRVTKKEIDRRIHQAKQWKLDDQMSEFGFHFCEECGRNDDLPLDCSHTISVKECQESGRSEMAWSLDNIRILGRKCHAIHDKNIIGGTK